MPGTTDSSRQPASAAVAVGARADVARRVQRAGCRTGTAAARPTTTAVARLAKARAVAPVSRTRRHVGPSSGSSSRSGDLGLLVLHGGVRLDHTRSVVAVPGQRHARRPGTPRSTGASSGSRSSLPSGAVAGTGAAPPDAAHDLVEQAVDALGEDLHLLLLQRHADDLRRRRAPAGRTCARPARPRCRRRTAPAGRRSEDLSWHAFDPISALACRSRRSAGAAAHGCVGAPRGDRRGAPSAAAASAPGRRRCR